jgi:di/tricarboxylate transporter
VTPQILILLIILAIALILFSFEWIAIDVVALGVMLALILTGVLTPSQAFAGFGSDTTLMILGLFILTAGLARTGVIELAGRLLVKQVSQRPAQALLTVMSAGAGLSSFISNTAATAFFVPIVMGLARRMHISASKLLMPVAFATILASSVTLIGTSTNLVVSGLMVQYGMHPMGVLELTPVGLPIMVVGILYMLVVGRRLIPERTQPEEELTHEFNLQAYTTEIELLANSSLIGKTLGEASLGRDLDLTVLRIQRAEMNYLAPQADFVLSAGDELLIEGRRDDIIKIKDLVGARITSEVTLSDPDLQTSQMQLAEVILLPRSPLIGRRLVGIDLRERHGLQALAINRHEGTIHRNISHIPLQLGDVLLVQGPPANLAALERNNAFRILGTWEGRGQNPRRARIAIAIFLVALLLGITEVVPLPVAVLGGAFVAFITRVITPEEAYRDVEWKAIILISSMLALGVAMESTGAAKYLAGLIVQATNNANPVWILSGFFLLTVALTQPMSNQAAAAVVLPVAIQAAIQLGLNPRAFAMMIAIAASTSFITPLEPACIIIFGLGHYRFLDFFKVGVPLTVAIYFIAILLVPVLWPL